MSVCVGGGGVMMHCKYIYNTNNIIFLFIKNIHQNMVTSFYEAKFMLKIF